MLRTPTPRQTKLSLGPPTPSKTKYISRSVNATCITANIRLYSVTANYAVTFVFESVFVHVFLKKAVSTYMYY